MIDHVLLMITATAALGFGVRYLPMVLLRGREFAPQMERLLRSLPIGILAALIAQSVFVRDGSVTAGLGDYYLHGLIVCLLIATFTRSLTALMLVGMAVVGLLHALGS